MMAKRINTEFDVVDQSWGDLWGEFKSAYTNNTFSIVKNTSERKLTVTLTFENQCPIDFQNEVSIAGLPLDIMRYITSYVNPRIEFEYTMLCTPSYPFVPPTITLNHVKNHNIYETLDLTTFYRKKLEKLQCLLNSDHSAAFHLPTYMLYVYIELMSNPQT